jgi:hypothetical protein
MAPETSDATDRTGEPTQDRRSFITTLAGLGALAIGATAASAAPALGRATQIGAAGQLARSNAALNLQHVPKLQRLTAARRPANLPTPPPPAVLGDPPLPSTRQRLLQGLFGPGTGLNASAFRLSSAGGVWGHSAPLTQVMSTNPLAQAYAAGITLTPSGCQYAPGTGYQSPGGSAPISFHTMQASVDPATWGKKLQLLTAKMNEVFSVFFAAFLVTPGALDQSLPYVLELSMEPFDPAFEVFVASTGPSGEYVSANVNFVATTEGTRMALVELPGCDGLEGPSHSLFFRRGNAQPLFTTFNWLNVMAL